MGKQIEHYHVGNPSVSGLPELEIRCAKCDGTGTYSAGGGDPDACDLCDGTGYETTPFGEKVMRLVRHQFRPSRRRMQCR
jgi:DnaJ-class molecular chaperone